MNDERISYAVLEEASNQMARQLQAIGCVRGDRVCFLTHKSPAAIIIELGEIETALNALGLLRECAVVAVNSDGFEGMAICCAYAPLPGAGGNPTTLRQALRRMLPSCMLPSHWIHFEQLPQNGNGKIDRRLIREHFLESIQDSSTW
jgi:acyl-coenzyme A synthetase/AMP-(fatty) acid ligase